MTKRLNVAGIFIALIFSLIAFSSCSDSSTSSNIDSKLDSNLFGSWTYVQGSNALIWKFNSDGTCIQTIYTQEVNWKWEIEDGKIKLYVAYGTPTYMKYKVEGNKLYIWVDQINDWGLPFTKVS